MRLKFQIRLFWHSLTSDVCKERERERERKPQSLSLITFNNAVVLCGILNLHVLHFQSLWKWMLGLIMLRLSWSVIPKGVYKQRVQGSCKANKLMLCDMLFKIKGIDQFFGIYGIKMWGNPLKKRRMDNFPALKKY